MQRVCAKTGTEQERLPCSSRAARVPSASFGAPIAGIVQFIVKIISSTPNQAMQNITTIINLIMPTDALWHGVSYYLIPDPATLEVLGLSTNGFNTPFTSAEPIAGALLIWVALYCVALPVLAAWRFQHRDL
jgi:ABC-2 type transport system permease protein